MEVGGIVVGSFGGRGRMVSRQGAWALGVAGLLAGSVALADVLHRRASAGVRAGHEMPTGRGVVVVLGVPGSNPLYRALQRWRIDLTLDAAGRFGCDPVIFTGGVTRPGPSEAAQMATVARSRGLDGARVVLEERSRTTRENIVEASRLAGPVDYVVLVSDALHASRARTAWREHAGIDAPHFVLADQYVPLRRFWLRTPVTVAEVLYRVGTGGRGRIPAPLDP